MIDGTADAELAPLLVRGAMGLRGAVAVAIFAALLPGIPRLAQLGTAVLLGVWSAIALSPASGAPLSVSSPELALVAAREIALGAALGVAAALPLAVAAVASGWVAGAAAAREQGALFSTLGAAVFLAVDGPAATLEAVAASHRAVPMLAAAPAAASAHEVIAGLIGAAVRLALPWLATAAIVEVAVAVAARVAGRAAATWPLSAAVPAAHATISAALVATFATGVAALAR